MLHVLKAPEIMNVFFAHDRVSFNEFHSDVILTWKRRFCDVKLTVCKHLGLVLFPVFCLLEVMGPHTI